MVEEDVAVRGLTEIDRSDEETIARTNQGIEIVDNFECCPPRAFVTEVEESILATDFANIQLARHAAHRQVGIGADRVEGNEPPDRDGKSARPGEQLDSGVGAWIAISNPLEDGNDGERSDHC